MLAVCISVCCLLRGPEIIAFSGEAIITKKSTFQNECKIKAHICGQFSWLNLQVVNCAAKEMGRNNVLTAALRNS